MISNQPAYSPVGERGPSTLQRAGSLSVVDTAAPRTVLRGAKCHPVTDEPVNEVSIDWLRMSGPKCQYWEALHLLQKRFGQAEEGKGRFGLNSGHHWAEGGIFQDLDKQKNARHCVFELPGKIISELEHHEVRQLIYDMHSMGFKTTRVDIAVDIYTMPDLINTVRESCEAGELCRAKTYQHIEQRSAGLLTGHGITIGKRGNKGSGRYLRVYDKGLETQTLDPGNWIRWESELSDDCAQQFTLKYACENESIACCLSHALWVVEFRQATGQRLSRRPLAEWYESFTKSVRPEKVRAVRAKSTIESYANWIKTSVVPKLASISSITGETVGGVLHHIAGQFNPRQEHIQCAKVRSVSKSLGATDLALHHDPNIHHSTHRSHDLHTPPEGS